MFNIPLYHYKIEDWETKRQQLLEICSTIDFKNQELNNRIFIKASGDNLYTDYGNDNSYKDSVCKILKNELSKFSEDAKLTSPFISNTWFQQYYKSQFHSPHNHGAYGYSSVTYIKYDKEIHQPTIFIAPYSDPSGNLIEYAPEVDEGHIIFFPAMITHYVLPSKTNDIRIILSLNVRDT